MYSELPIWQRLVSHQHSTDERTALITSIFSDRREVEVVERLSGNDAQGFVDRIDEVSSNAVTCSVPMTTPLNPSHVVHQALDHLAPEIQMRCLHYLSRICGRQSLLPRSPPNPLRYYATELSPRYNSKVATVWKGKCDGQLIAARVLKDPGGDSERIRKVGYA